MHLPRLFPPPRVLEPGPGVADTSTWSSPEALHRNLAQAVCAEGEALARRGLPRRGALFFEQLRKRYRPEISRARLRFPLQDLR